MSDAVLETWREGRFVARPTRSLLVAAAGAACAVGLVALALLGLSAALSRPDAPPAPPPLRPMWLEIQKPVRIFSLEARALDNLPLVYAARRRSVGDGREDVLALGTLVGDAPALRLTLLRVDGQRMDPKAPSAPLFAALAREAADAGLSIARSGLPDLMPTRFGRFEVADITLAAPAGRTPERACSGFRLALDAPVLSMTGLACGGPQPLTREMLACLIDRLDVASGGEDRSLVEFFARTDLKRNTTCAGMRLGPDGLHAAWLDDKPATSRKSLRRH